MQAVARIVLRDGEYRVRVDFFDEGGAIIATHGQVAKSNKAARKALGDVQEALAILGIPERA